MTHTKTATAYTYSSDSVLNEIVNLLNSIPCGSPIAAYMAASSEEGVPSQNSTLTIHRAYFSTSKHWKELYGILKMATNPVNVDFIGCCINADMDIGGGLLFENLSFKNCVFTKFVAPITQFLTWENTPEELCATCENRLFKSLMGGKAHCLKAKMTPVDLGVSYARGEVLGFKDGAPTLKSEGGSTNG